MKLTWVYGNRQNSKEHCKAMLIKTSLERIMSEKKQVLNTIRVKKRTMHVYPLEKSTVVN